MRPCEKCGTAIANDSVVCQDCLTKDAVESDAEIPLQSPDRPRRTSIDEKAFSLLGFVLELTATAAIVIVPISVVCTIISLFFFPDWSALKWGFGFGAIASFGFAIVHWYLQAQVLRKPLE